jgi:hypothetical protein
MDYVNAATLGLIVFSKKMGLRARAHHVKWQPQFLKNVIRLSSTCGTELSSANLGYGNEIATQLAED